MLDSAPLPNGYYIPAAQPYSDLKGRVRYLSRATVLNTCMALAVHVPGNIVEFGVASGASTREIKRSLRQYNRPFFARHGSKKLFALDSFEGLREKFENAEVGEFAGAVPNISGVNFVKGYFEDTCTDELRRRVGRVAFAHLDADLHSSTKFALHWLNPMLETGSLLLFDEFIGGDFAENRAFEEWQSESGTQVIRIAEFDRDPSGFGTVPDRRLLYQVIGKEQLSRHGKNSPAWKLAYYLKRLGFEEWADRISSKLV
jgi:hypothetical protein